MLSKHTDDSGFLQVTIDSNCTSIRFYEEFQQNKKLFFAYITLRVKLIQDECKSEVMIKMIL